MLDQKRKLPKSLSSPPPLLPINNRLSLSLPPRTNATRPRTATATASSQQPAASSQQPASFLPAKEKMVAATATANQETALHRSSAAALKFLCSYGGKILPRRPDGRLRYVGGVTRILAVDRSVSYAELMAKLAEFCGSPVATLKCELPGGDLETLVSVKSDEDLANLIEEYDEASRRSRSSASSSPPGARLQIRAVLFEPRPRERASPPPLSPSPSAASSSGSSPRDSPRLVAGGWSPRRSFSPRIAAGVGCGGGGGGSPTIGRYRNFYGPGQPGVACAAVHCCRNYCQ